MKFKNQESISVSLARRKEERFMIASRRHTFAKKNRTSAAPGNHLPSLFPDSPTLFAKPHLTQNQITLSGEDVFKNYLVKRIRLEKDL